MYNNWLIFYFCWFRKDRTEISNVGIALFPFQGHNVVRYSMSHPVQLPTGNYSTFWLVLFSSHLYGMQFIMLFPRHVRS